MTIFLFDLVSGCQSCLCCSTRSDGKGRHPALYSVCCEIFHAVCSSPFEVVAKHSLLSSTLPSQAKSFGLYDIIFTTRGGNGVQPSPRVSILSSNGDSDNGGCIRGSARLPPSRGRVAFDELGWILLTEQVEAGGSDCNSGSCQLQTEAPREPLP